jgi:hypothetical protein
MFAVGLFLSAFALAKRNARRAALASLAFIAVAPFAHATDDVGDPTTITAAATTAFDAVTVLVVAMVSFYIIVRIVKGIRR